MAWVFDHSVATLASRLVLLSIANHASKIGSNAYCSTKTIAEEAHVSERQVHRAIAALAGTDELLVWVGGGPTTRGGRTNRYEMPLVPGWERPDDMPSDATVSGDILSDDESGSGDICAPKGCHPVPEVVTSAPSAPHVEPLGTKTEPPPYPPQAGGGKGNVVPIRQSQHPAAMTASLPALGTEQPLDALAAALALLGLGAIEQVETFPEAVGAWYDSQTPRPLIERHKVDRMSHDANRAGWSPGEFLFALCGSNVATPAGLDLFCKRFARGDLPGLRKPSLGPRAEQLARGHERAARRMAAERAAVGANAIDVDGWES